MLHINISSVLKRKRKIVGLLLYILFARHLPVSYSLFKIGQKRIRAFCGKMILDYCGKNVNIEKAAVFSSKVQLGDNSGIGLRAHIGGKCIIGNDVMMGPDCIIYTRNHNFESRKYPMRLQGYRDEEPVIIGDDVWIGGRVIILPGVHIGAHSIIGTGAVVTKNVPEWSIVVGNPARVVKKRHD